MYGISNKLRILIWELLHLAICLSSLHTRFEARPDSPLRERRKVYLGFKRCLIKWRVQMEMAQSKIFQARTAHSKQHSSYWPPVDWHLLFSKPVCPCPAKQFTVLSFLSPEAKYLQRLFCLLRQNICWDYFAFCGPWLVEVDISCDKHNKQSCMLGLLS